MKTFSCKHGFTLVEMAVVLVIIALIAGGIVMGRELITQAENRAVIGEYAYYLKAIQEFQDKYQALPGDMNNAETMWGTDGGGCPGSYTDTLPVTTATCNGNGDGMIGSCLDDFSIACTGTTEIWRAWQHLSNAGMIDSRHTGIGQDVGGVRSGAVVGVNTPASKRTPAGWTLLHYSNPNNESWTDDENWVDQEIWLAGDVREHVLMLGGGRPLTGLFTTYPALPSRDALDIDRKMDDGRPRTGKIFAWENIVAASNCVDGDNDYDLCTGNACRCGLIFMTDF